MKKQILLLALIALFSSSFMQSQDMNNANLEKIFYVVSDSIQGSTGNWQFIIENTLLICVTDETHNRMRIISPIIEVLKISTDEKQKLLEANFHSALDARYAISDGYVWSAFIHPLKELTKDQVMDAISQVYVAALTFGTTYNSSGLSFPGNTDDSEETEDGIKVIELKDRKKHKI